MSLGLWLGGEGGRLMSAEDWFLPSFSTQHSCQGPYIATWGEMGGGEGVLTRIFCKSFKNYYYLLVIILSADSSGWGAEAGR